jgi:geranylgeranyl diphosphate synthase type II
VDVEAYIAERTHVVNIWLDDFVPPPEAPPERLHAAMRHLLFPGGKRLRPAFALAAAEAVGAPPEVALPAAAAVELVHTYSLIHDDLPCMDDDVERRGVPTVHVAFDEAIAVLAGDALLALAFEALTAGVSASPIEASRAALAVSDLAQAAGSVALVGGQVDDVAAEARGVELDTAAIESIHARKSAALIAAAVVTGARLAGAEEPLLERLHHFAMQAGIAFQITDDCLDRDGLAPVLGEDAARARAEALLEQALVHIEDLGERAEPLRELARFAVRRDG